MSSGESVGVGKVSSNDGSGMCDRISDSRIRLLPGGGPGGIYLRIPYFNINLMTLAWSMFN